jgi:hypothetical protein
LLNTSLRSMSRRIEEDEKEISEAAESID